MAACGAAAVRAAERWLDAVVIRHGLCPFVAGERRRRTKVVACSADAGPACVEWTMQELDTLVQERQRAPGTAPVTALLCFTAPPWAAWDAFRAHVAAPAKVLAKTMRAPSHVLPFHPLAAGAGLSADDAANYRFRSPVPVLHLLHHSDLLDSALGPAGNRPSPDPRQAAEEQRAAAAMGSQWYTAQYGDQARHAMERLVTRSESIRGRNNRVLRALGTAELQSLLGACTEGAERVRPPAAVPVQAGRGAWSETAAAVLAQRQWQEQLQALRAARRPRTADA
eukprot:TRINITY_DN66772_c0_g1_i1.p3 TRINITY_DN66772_c0_g1~~TRINITY_DN66772_c0_g1_i1.p3  ORF type:complete len:282 (+),score=84.06 TRINITY_DN66772_c0_g1_i1:72-917(+)